LLQQALREAHVAEYDLVIRNTTIATAADVVKGDIGISAGRVVAWASGWTRGRRRSTPPA
jgi:dihydropyrimidinase